MFVCSNLKGRRSKSLQTDTQQCLASLAQSLPTAIAVGEGNSRTIIYVDISFSMNMLGNVPSLPFSHILLSLLYSLSCLPSTTTSACESTPPCPASGLTTWEQIQQTLRTYPLAIDTKDFGLLTAVFAPTATANYLSNLTSIAAI